MTNPQIPLETGRFYHIYNRGTNSCELFQETTNYEHFLRLYDKHIESVAETYAWCLMGNHFHLLIRIKDEQELLQLLDFEGLQGEDLIKRIHQRFSNLFNAYSKSFNKKYKRTGSLFENRFRRKLIDTDDYFRNTIIYIHNNPVHHGFCTKIDDYRWSSYDNYITNNSPQSKLDVILEWFGDEENFKYLHQSAGDLDLGMVFN